MKPRPLAVLARTRPYSLILARARSCSPCPVREQAGTEFMDYLKKIVSDQDITTTKHSVGDKDVFTVSTWSGVV